MAATRETLFDLFGDPTAVWPSTIVREHTGFEAGAPASPATWLAALNNSVHVSDVRTAAGPGRVAVEAALTVLPGAGFLGYPDGWPFVIESMPDVEFRIRPFSAAGRSVRMFASVADDGFELVLEGLPVEIRLPDGLVSPHPDQLGAGNVPVEQTVGSFTAGALDDLQVVYRSLAPTSVFVHVRVTLTSAGEFHLQPSVPVSFGPCTLSGIPCVAVHDFRLIPSPELTADHDEWVRHSLTPWLPSMTGPYDGLFSARTIDVDETAPAIADLAEWLNEHSTDSEPTAELVLDDVVVPFFGPLGLPVPRHITVGLRRRVLDPGSTTEVFSFERAPVHIVLSQDPGVAFIVDSFFYRSQPSETIGENLGLTFSAAIVWGADEGPQKAFAFGLEEEYTVVVGYRRDFDAAGDPATGTGVDAVLNTLLHWEIAGTVIVDIVAIRVGFSFGRKFGGGKSVGDSLLATADVMVSMPPTGADGAFFRLRSLSGEKVRFVLEGLGWRFGSFHFEGVSMPDGVVAYIGPVGLIFSEIGLRAEQGASYLSFSGGLMINTSGFEGGLVVRRLRFRIAGDATRPAFKIDGFFLTLKTSTVKIEAGGYYTDEESGGTRVREFGLTGTVGFDVGGRSYTVGVDLIVGNRKSPSLEFDYFMIQAFFRGQLGPIGYFELTGIRFLFARNMLPKLGALDKESRDLRYYSWYRSSNPLVVSGDRRLAAWVADNGSWTFGLGAGASLSGMGKVIELSIFVLGMVGPTESGFLIVGELYLLASPTPVGYLAIEWDGKNDRFSMVIGVNAKVSSFLQGAPAWVDSFGSLTGTMFISNDPATFAIGRLADQRTWLTLKTDLSWGVRLFLSLGFCVEIVEGPTGPKGFALAIRFEGGIAAGSVVSLVFHAGFGFAVLIFTTGSTDYSIVVWIEAGLRFTLFGFLHIGVSARAEFRAVGSSPSRGELSLEVRLETPWFLPDVTWRFQTQFGTLAPADLASSSQPLRSAGVTEEGTRKQLGARLRSETGAGGNEVGLHLERFDPSWDGQGVAPVHSVTELSAPTADEAGRLARLAGAGLRPVATDSTVSIAFSVAVNDRLALGTGMAAGLGDQHAGDLDLTYDLVGIRTRRRPRFGAARPWTDLGHRVELGADFTDPNGVVLDGAFAPQVLSTTWDLDVTVAGVPAPKTLLVNSVAPFSFATRSPETDEGLALDPAWPCCRPPDDKTVQGLLHEITWRNAVPGADLPGVGVFTDSASTLRFPQPAWTRPALFAGLATPTLVAAVTARIPAVLARADLDEDAARCWFRLAWPLAGRVSLVAFDSAGKEVGRSDLGAGTAAHQVVVLGASGPIRRVEIRGYLAQQGLSTSAAASSLPVGTAAGAVVEVDWVAYVGLRDLMDQLLAGAACDAGVPAGAPNYEGHGQLAFLPNNEYEVRLTTRVGVKHPSTAVASADVEEFVYFATKGLPGLNAVDRVGAELEPYVRSTYTGGRGRTVYRAEPITVAFSEGFHVAVPLAQRPPGTSAEHTTLLRMLLTTTPDVAIAPGTVETATAQDWLVANRSTVPAPTTPGPWEGTVGVGTTRASAMVSVDPRKERLAALTQRPTVPCDLADPRLVVGTVLVAPPQGGGPDPQGTGELWLAGSRLTAAVRVEGAGFVDRRPFAAGDETAMTSVPAGRWSVADGELRSAGAGRSFAVLGEADWNHLAVVATIAPGAVSAGIGVGLAAGSTVPQGLFALVEAAGAGPARLVVRRRTGGGSLTEVEGAELPAGVGTGPEPVTLEVAAYDDVLRVSVGETRIDVDRGDLREGRLCLTADGSAAVQSLRVQGLDLYTFPVAVSRYRSFEEHLGSWSGRLGEIAADTLGAGTTTSTVGALRAATGAERAAVMAPDATDDSRQDLFARWADALGLPLLDEVTAVGISRVVEAAQTAALLLESPEPIDFTAEVIATLVRRDRTVPPPDLPVGGHRPPKPRVPLGTRLRPGREITGRLDDLLTAGPGAGPLRERLPDPDSAIYDVDDTSRGLRLTIHPAFLGDLAVVALDRDGTPVLLRGTVSSRGLEPRPRSRVLDATVVGPLADKPPAGSELADALAVAAPGVVLLLTQDLTGVLGVWHPRVVDVDVPVAVDLLQSGDGRRALAVPAAPLPPGRYRLTLQLSRPRWATTEPADDLNTAAGEAILAFEL